LKKYLRFAEKPFLIAYASILLLVYVLSRFFLEMYTDHSPSALWGWSLVFIVPISLYATARTVFSQGYKWYSAIGYFVTYTLGGLVTSNYIIVNGDLLISSAINKESLAKADVVEVRKVYYKSGFDHTSVTLKTAKKEITLQGRPFIYFYLNGKKDISVRYSNSFLGNDYIYIEGIGSSEKLSARWLHFKDQINRAWIFIGIITALVLVGFLAPKKLQKNMGDKSVKIGFWKLIAIVMGIVFALGLLLYAGLFLYVKIFSGRHF